MSISIVWTCSNPPTQHDTIWNCAGIQNILLLDLVKWPIYELEVCFYVSSSIVVTDSSQRTFLCFKWYVMQEISSIYHWNLSIFLCDAFTHISLLGLKAEQWPHEHAPFQHTRQLIIGMCVVCMYISFVGLPCLDHCQITGGIRLRSIIFLLCGGSLFTYISRLYVFDNLMSYYFLLCLVWL